MTCAVPVNEDDPEVIECDLCRRTLGTGDGYHTVTLGFDDTPRYVGMPILAESTVESTSELLICSRCEPAATERFERLLAAFWELRAPDPVRQVPEEPVPDTLPASMEGETRA